MLTLLSLQSTEMALLASLVLGVACGLLGSFVVVRRIALVGDTLSHAVLPGVVAGMLWSPERDPYVILSLAALAGLLGVVTVQAIVKSTRIKSDAALGIVLASFFGIGLLWKSRARVPGVSDFLFGNAGAISEQDLVTMSVVSLLLVVIVFLLYRPFLVLSFDEGFAKGLGYPVGFLNALFYGLLSFAVVVAMQAVGVILVSAMLVTPAAAASLFTERLRTMALWSMLIGVLSGGIGCFLSIHLDGLKTGAVITLVASGFFTLSYLFAPQQGVLAKQLRRGRERQRVARENILKSIYHMMEAEDFRQDGVTKLALAEWRKIDLESIERSCQKLIKVGEARVGHDALIYLTNSGWRRAVEIVRNHRLWELYLTNQADYAPDHVHDDAEKVEHVLSGEMLRKLEKDLNFPEVDPHGKPIPSVEKTLQDLSKERGALS